MSGGGGAAPGGGGNPPITHHRRLVDHLGLVYRACDVTPLLALSSSVDFPPLFVSARVAPYMGRAEPPPYLLNYPGERVHWVSLVARSLYRVDPDNAASCFLDAADILALERHWRCCIPPVDSGISGSGDALLYQWDGGPTKDEWEIWEAREFIMDVSEVVPSNPKARNSKQQRILAGSRIIPANTSVNNVIYRIGHQRVTTKHDGVPIAVFATIVARCVAHYLTMATGQPSGILHMPLMAPGGLDEQYLTQLALVIHLARTTLLTRLMMPVMTNTDPRLWVSPWSSLAAINLECGLRPVPATLTLQVPGRPNTVVLFGVWPPDTCHVCQRAICCGYREFPGTSVVPELPFILAFCTTCVLAAMQQWPVGVEPEEGGAGAGWCENPHCHIHGEHLAHE